MIGCREAFNHLWEYLDESVTVDERVLVEEHLARCRTCCGELEFTRQLRRMLADRASSDLKDEVLHRLNRTIEEVGR